MEFRRSWISSVRSIRTIRSARSIRASGGRVLCVVGLGDNVKMAQKQAYAAVDSIHFDGAQFRRDIGWRAIKRHG